MLSMGLIGIPLKEVGDRLRALDKSLRENGMALKAETGVHVNYSRDGETAISFELEVYPYTEKKESEDVKL